MADLVTPSAGDSESKVMLELATPDLYRNNAFRILGLTVNVPSGDLIKRQNRMKMRAKLGENAPLSESAILPLDPPPDIDLIRKAIQRLHDPESRIIDEMFWFWPIDNQNSTGDKGLMSMRQGDLLNASRFWLQLIQDRDKRSLANHNLAVFHHAIALDMESATAVDLIQAKMKLNMSCDDHWQAAFKYWSAAIDDEGMWERIVDRICELDDPRLTVDMIRRLRRTLPIALLTLSIRLAVHSAKQCDVNAARRHLSYIHGCGLDASLAGDILNHEVSPLRDQVEQICEPILVISKNVPEHADILAEQLISDTKPLLTAIYAVLGEHHQSLQFVADQVADAIRECTVAYVNATKSWRRCLELLKATIEIAIGDDLRSRLQEDIEKVERYHRVYGVLKPINIVPPLRTINGLGFTLYGCSDYDLETHSYMATYYFVFFFIPIFPIRRYRVIQQDKSYRFLGKASLRRGDKIHLAVMLVLIIGIFLGLILTNARVQDSTPSSSSPSPLHSIPKPNIIPDSTTSSSSPSPLHSIPKPNTIPDSKTSSSKPPPLYSIQNPNVIPLADLVNDLFSLKKKIIDKKAHVKKIESEIEQMDAELESLSSEISLYKNKLEYLSNRITLNKIEIDGYKRQIQLGIYVDQFAYRKAIDNYNEFVEQHNLLLAKENERYTVYEELLTKRNAKFTEYEREIDSVNEMVRRYNSGER